MNYSTQVEWGQYLYHMFDVTYATEGSIDITDKFFDKHKIKERITFTKYLKALLEHFIDRIDTNVIVYRDATASGMQIMAALSGCEFTGRLTNLTSEIRECAYTEVIGVMNRDIAPAEQIDRDVGKQCLMTHYYCSTATPRKLLTPSQQHVFYTTINNIFKGPELVMNTIIDAWTDKDTFTWSMPDQHVAHVKMSDVQAVGIEWHGAEFQYEYSEHKANGNYRHLAANIIQAFDAYIARQMQLMARDQGFDLVSNHDSFGSLPQHSRKALRNYQTIMQGICDNNYLQDVLREITGNPELVFNKISEGMKVTSEYCICS